MLPQSKGLVLARRVFREAREHKRAARWHRRAAQEKMERLRHICEEFGLELHILTAEDDVHGRQSETPT